MSSWVEYLPHHPFPIQNLPYGVFRSKSNSSPRPCTAIGDFVVDLRVLARAGLLPSEVQDTFEAPTLNRYMSLGRPVWQKVREALTKLFKASEGTLRDNAALRAEALIPTRDTQMVLPCDIGDYTDFYASKEHATNLGKMFRPGQPPLLPNWLHLPVGYHGRASSIVVSGTPIRRPWGQQRPNDEEPPIFSTCKLLDMEVELATYIGVPNDLGNPISIRNAKEHVFGFSVFNDWSARDIQKWEYVPLGPFLGKNFGSTISPWIVTLEALEPFAVPGPVQDPTPFEYLKQPFAGNYDIRITATLSINKGTESQVVSETNSKYLYWSTFQQVVHHTVNGCNLRPGDVLASGTISGPTQGSLGSFIEITNRGQQPITFPSGAQRKFLQDGDSLNLTAECVGDGYRIGFGDCEGTVVPALSSAL